MRSHLNLRQLEAIVAVADNGSLSAAAGKLHVSQPALSRTVRLAEEALNARIFDRDSHSLSLTAAGEELLAIARRIVAEFNDSVGGLAEFVEGRRGRVRLSALPSLAGPALFDAAAHFSKSHPAVEFVLRIDTAEDVLARLERREIDIGLTVQPPAQAPFDYRHLHDDALVLVCRRDDPLIQIGDEDQALDWSVLGSRPFIGMAAGSTTRSATDAVFAQLGLAIRPAHEVATSNMVLVAGMVAAGMGLSVMTRSAMETLNSAELATRPLSAPAITRKVGLVTLAGRTLAPAVDQFCALVLARGV